MQSGPAPKPMAVTVYQLTTCPHCRAANGVTAIRCWSCDQPLSDQRWTGEVSPDELAPAREPSLTDSDFTFLDEDLHARQKKAAVEDAVATANTFASTRTLSHSASAKPSLPHRPQVVERIDAQSPSPPTPWQTSDTPAFDQPLAFDAPLPFAEAALRLSARSEDRDRLHAVQDESVPRFSVRGSGSSKVQDRAFGRRLPVEAIVLTLVIGTVLYAYLQPATSTDDAPRLPSMAKRAPGIDAETQRLLDLSSPSNVDPADAQRGASADLFRSAPQLVIAPSASQAPAAVVEAPMPALAPSAPTAEAQVRKAEPLAGRVDPPVRSGCPAHTAALGLC